MLLRIDHVFVASHEQLAFMLALGRAEVGVAAGAGFGRRKGESVQAATGSGFGGATTITIPRPLHTGQPGAASIRAASFAVGNHQGQGSILGSVLMTHFPFVGFWATTGGSCSSTFLITAAFAM